MFQDEIPPVDCSPAAARLLAAKAPHRVHDHDASLYSFNTQAQSHASGYMGWTDLASQPPTGPDEIDLLARRFRAQGLQSVVLIGQGGSTQASAAISQLMAFAGRSQVDFHVMDTLAPDEVNAVLDSCDPAHTVYIVSSKSGSTLEPTLLERVAWQRVAYVLGADAAGKRFVAITSEGSLLASRAQSNGYAHTFLVPGSVGGRYSALSAFGLFPMALMGFDISALLRQGAHMEKLCSLDSPTNPALRLASFLMDNLSAGRDKLTLLLPYAAHSFGLWVEQLVAESLGKEGKGILPSMEFASRLFFSPRDDRTLVEYRIGSSLVPGFDLIDPSIPRFFMGISDPADVIEHFVLWEYAVALCGHLLEVNPFDQPDVESTKVATRALLFGTDERTAASSGTSSDGPGASLSSAPDAPSDVDGPSSSVSEPWKSAVAPFRNSQVEVRFSQALLETMDLQDHSFGLLDFKDALASLFAATSPGDYFAISAFMPARDASDRSPLDRIRTDVAESLGLVSALGIGPRYLHSTGQFHKGGPNSGVFLVLCSHESDDIPVPEEDFTLNEVLMAQAAGDFEALAARGRRALFVRLPDNSSLDMDTLTTCTREALASLPTTATTSTSSTK